MIATIVILCLLASGVFVSFFKHGEPKGKWNFWVQLIAAAITLWLYYEAGMFDKFMN